MKNRHTTTNIAQGESKRVCDHAESDGTKNEIATRETRRHALLRLAATGAYVPPALLSLLNTDPARAAEGDGGSCVPGFC